ncbi:hypothetical protein D9613_005891 [Agrocybe pediades]|uniref:Endo-1,5-alpha-L-arabinanase A n=1 Tax=Agrocybe pediades TaxID=84607 RepID=A0A8H4QVF3_9AGAR|nr:hypothetical protein D9613_005891 [Agrocybe pediades]
MALLGLTNTPALRMETYGPQIVPISTVNSTFGSQNSAIFFAKSSTGQPGSFTNLGLVTSTSSANNYNAIVSASRKLTNVISRPLIQSNALNLLGPIITLTNFFLHPKSLNRYGYKKDYGNLVQKLTNFITDGGNWLLSLGSFWTGIKEMTLSPSTGKLASSTVTSLAQRTANGGAIEASVIYKHGSFYYLFTSWDKCCQGTSSTYNIRVGRSTSPTSGFVDQAGVALTSGGGTLVLGTHDNIVGPGGQDLMDDADGPILVYHYYTSAGSFLGINRLDFSSGWPVVV